MRADSWGGLITNASPYAIGDKAPGSATVQDNLTGIVPGQVSVRGGMRPVTHTEWSSATPPVASPGSATPAALDCFSYDFQNKKRLIVLASDGKLLALESPASGSLPAAPTLPSLDASAAAITTDYAMRCNRNGG
jgi:hypothetical protein